MHKIVSFVLSESQRMKGGEAVIIPVSESAPHYFGASVPKQFLIDKEEHEVKGKKVIFDVRAYLPDILVAEVQVEVENVFNDEAFDLKEALIDQCHEIIKRRGGKFELSEEYSIAIVSDYDGEPEQFFKYGAKIASFLKSERLLLDEKEIVHTLSHQIKYAQDDLVIVDWDGAFIFDPVGEYESIVELLQIANLQLLKYRGLDHDLDLRLRRIARVVQSQAERLNILKNYKITQDFKAVINTRARSIAEFEAVDREIKLIGDWYPARLYNLMAHKMRLNEWKDAVKEKMDSLEDVYTIVAENFSMSRVHFLEFIQILLFFVLQVGWFVLIILEFIYYTK